MSSPTGCPTDSEMERLLAGRLPDKRTDALAEHFNECHSCQDRVLDEVKLKTPIQRLLGDLSVYDKHPPALSEVEETDVLPNLVSRLEALGTVDSRPSSAAIERTNEAESYSFLAPPEQPDEIGRLAHYRILDVLGRGGIGIVFLAEDTQLKRRIAVKVLQTKYAQRPEARERLLREARSLAGIKHDNIAVLHDVGETAPKDGTEAVTYLVLDLLEGQSLLDWMKDHPKPSIEMILSIGRQTAAGLSAAHGRGLAHRDIKPGNLWLELRDGVEGGQGGGVNGGQGDTVTRGQRDKVKDQLPSVTPSPPHLVTPSLFRLKILDFGLAAPVAEANTETVGTPGYAAPEQVHGEHVDSRSDLFALGCVLYELCTGTLPFPLDLQSFRKRAFKFRPPRAISESAPEIPAALARLIQRLLAEIPMERPASAREVEHRLAKIERRLWLHRQPRWVRWAGTAAIALFVAGLVWGFGPYIWRARDDFEAPVILSPVLANTIHRPGPPDESWRRFVAELAPQQQAQAVSTKLAELNPGFVGWLTSAKIELGVVTEVSLLSDTVTDIRPLRALRKLRSVSCTGTSLNVGQLADLSPLAELPLETLIIRDNSFLVDFDPLKSFRLVHFDASGTGLSNLDNLDGSKLQVLDISNTQVRNLDPIQNMPNLERLTCLYCPIDNLTSLLPSSVQHLDLSYRPERDRAVLLGMERLVTINGLAASDFRRKYGISP